MKQTTFFTISAIFILLMAGYFSIQLTALPAKWCLPEFDWECEANAQVACEGQFGSARYEFSTCMGYTCRAYWELFCDQGPYSQIEHQWCDDDNNPYCEW